MVKVNLFQNLQLIQSVFFLVLFYQSFTLMTYVVYEIRVPEMFISGGEEDFKYVIRLASFLTDIISGCQNVRC